MDGQLGSPAVRRRIALESPFHWHSYNRTGRTNQRSIEPIRLRSMANGIWAGRGCSGLTICGQVTTSGHGVSLAIPSIERAPKRRQFDFHLITVSPFLILEDDCAEFGRGKRHRFRAPKKGYQDLEAPSRPAFDFCGPRSKAISQRAGTSADAATDSPEAT